MFQLPASLESPVYTADGSDTFHLTARHQEYVFRYLAQGPPLVSNDLNTKKLNLSLLELCFVVSVPVSIIKLTHHSNIRVRDVLTLGLRVSLPV